ncbi:branched-chain amino acid ABC transporter permease [Mesorhizobium sp.]|uniref:branched-chain amino acid ABC transporter permease n=1 Tax=Mesorhizobium sp. TaxID=1871066 RepID=UPI000FE9281C|nr:branched-chain amino acid ABC transporter permease [Mesorhizobium sp.]RWG06110.1 MAG: branched-chain amino acid ABC transporter permease [Mesorhizobium sp.]TIR90680.1 MAG: branched-chain amino acid ABC transporter permease [Mesorhizobium sp.]
MGNLLIASFDILSFGAIIVLVVLGLGIIASMMGIFNFAQGEFVLLGAYVTYLFYASGLPVWAGMLAAPVIVGIFGFALEALVVRRFYAAPTMAMLGTYALGLIIRETVRSLTGGFYLKIPEPISGSIILGSVQISSWRFTIVVVTILIIAASYLLLSKTSFGLKVRATLENPSLARASGISTRQIYGATFAFGAALAGLAGALIVPVFTLSADLGARFLIQGFIAVLVGGIGSFIGPVAGASVVGVLSAGLPWVIPPVIADVLVFVLAIAFVKFRPQGLISARGV